MPSLIAPLIALKITEKTHKENVKIPKITVCAKLKAPNGREIFSEIRVKNGKINKEERPIPSIEPPVPKSPASKSRIFCRVFLFAPRTRKMENSRLRSFIKREKTIARAKTVIIRMSIAIMLKKSKK